MPITVAVNSPPRGAPPSSDNAIVGHKTIGLILTQVLQSLCGEGGKGFSTVVMSRKPSPTEVQVLFRQTTSVEKKRCGFGCWYQWEFLTQIFEQANRSKTNTDWIIVRPSWKRLLWLNLISYQAMFALRVVAQRHYPNNIILVWECLWKVFIIGRENHRGRNWGMLLWLHDKMQNT